MSLTDVPRESTDRKAFSGPGTRSPGTPVKVKLGKPSFKTPAARKRVAGKREYRAFRSDERVARAVARTSKCMLCSRPARIIEHCHRFGHFRGHVCGKCNAADRESVKKARCIPKLTRQEYEAGKGKLTTKFWEVYSQEMARRVPSLNVNQARQFVTGELWKTLRSFATE